MRSIAVHRFTAGEHEFLRVEFLDNQWNIDLSSRRGV